MEYEGGLRLSRIRGDRCGAAARGGAGLPDKVLRLVAGKFVPTTQSGSATKEAAIDREAVRRVEEQEKHELAKAGSPVAAAPPRTPAMLLEEYFQQRVDVTMAGKTRERYRKQAAMLVAGLVAMAITGITPLQLSGHHRKTKAPRRPPLRPCQPPSPRR